MHGCFPDYKFVITCKCNNVQFTEKPFELILGEILHLNLFLKTNFSRYEKNYITKIKLYVNQCILFKSLQFDIILIL